MLFSADRFPGDDRLDFPLSSFRVKPRLTWRSEKSSRRVKCLLMVKSWFVYILTNYPNSVLYTGITNNLNRRISEHKEGLIKDSFTSRYKLYKLLWFEEFPSPNEAIQVEKRVKDFRRDKKINLIKLKNPNFQDLFTLRKV